MNRALIFLGLAGCLGCDLGSSSARAESPGVPSKVPDVAECFRADMRLSSSITVAEKNRPLGEWLRALGTTLNVKLGASREAADHKVTLFVDGRPAAEVLTLVARHQGFEWRGGKNGYTLLEGDKTRSENERGQRLQWQAIQVWMDRLARLAALPPDQINARRAEVEKLLGDKTLDPAPRSSLLEEQALFRDLSRHSRAVPIMIQIYRSLGVAQLEQLRTTGFLRLSSAYGSLSGAAAAATHEAMASGGFPAPPEVARHAELCLVLEEVAREPQHPNGARQLRLRAELLAVVQGRSSSSVEWRLRTPPPEGFPQAFTVPENDPDFKRAIEMKLPAARPALEMAVAGATAYNLQSWKVGMVTVAQVAEALHAETGLEIAADSFMRARVDPTQLLGKKTVAEVLKVLDEELDVTWKKEGRLLLLSSRSRVYDRDAEVPERVIRPFRARMLAQPAPTVDDLAQLAANLTDSQCRGLTDCWGWYLEGAHVPAPWVSGGIYELRYHLRLWGSLTGAQRREAQAGRLGMDAMSARQRRLCGLAISAPGDDLNRPDAHQIPTPESLARLAVAFTLRPREVESQTYQDDEGRAEADITPVGGPRANEFNRRRFGGRPRVAVGPSIRMHAFDFIYYVSDGTVEPRIARSINLHLVPRWPP